MSTELQVPEDRSPAAMLTAAIEKGLDAEGIVKLAEVFERMEAQRAQRAFNAAMTAFQAVCPTILKTKTIEFPTKRGGNFKAKFAPLDDIIEQTRTLRQQHGFSYTFQRAITATGIEVACIVRHIGGHQESTLFRVPLPKEAKISEAHEIAGAVTFCERYAYRGAFGLSVGVDNDGKEYTSGALISEQQLQTLRSLIDEVRPDSEKFLRFAGIERLEDLPARDFARVEQALQQRRKNP